MTIDSTATMVANFVKETGGDIDNRKLTAINLSYATEKLKTLSSEVFEAKKTTKDFDKLIYGVVLLDYLIKQGQLDGIDITNRSLAYGVMLDIEMNPTAPK
ncbi:MAG: hypothetical protein HY843_03075 [Bdellovibrio sp.]|nr:hypothetical protein [Bdellovibrio sp.]